MMDETKDTIFIILDILDSLGKSSKNENSFIKLDENKLKQVKNELFNLLQNESSNSNIIYNKKDKSYNNVINHMNTSIINRDVSSRKKDLVGMLPYILMDEKKFPNNESIVKLAEKSLNYKVLSWKTRSKNAIIGSIIAEICKDSDDNLENFYRVWKEFINEEEANIQNNTQDPKNKKLDYVDTWLEFFDHYKKR